MHISTQDSQLVTANLAGRMFMLSILLFLASFSRVAMSHSVEELFVRTSQAVAEVQVLEVVVKGTTHPETLVISNQGSGVLLSPDGKMATAAHLVQSADEITVVFAHGDKVRAKVIASEPAVDVALLQLDHVPSGMKPATLGDSDTVAIGEQVFIVGAPYGLHPTVTVGHLGGRHEPAPPFGPFEPLEMFQTDAVIAKGSSGAPLFNLRGEVIGIATGVQINDGRFEGLGFAVTANTLRGVLLEEASVWTGISGRWVAGHLAVALNIPQAAAMLVERVASHSPASRLKLQAGTAPARVGSEKFILGGDVILAVQGVSLAEEGGYMKARQALLEMREGDPLRMRICGTDVSLNSVALSRGRLPGARPLRISG